VVTKRLIPHVCRVDGPRGELHPDLAVAWRIDLHRSCTVMAQPLVQLHISLDASGLQTSAYSALAIWSEASGSNLPHLTLADLNVRLWRQPKANRSR